MSSRTINSIDVTINGAITDAELSIYLIQQQGKSTHKIIRATVTVDGEFIDINTVFAPVPFDRIRRITGYLVGSTDRFCNSKRAEEKDRVKHGCVKLAQSAE